jgi:pimeloyl-ACP methyl ester carboxylesterase
MLSAQAAQRLEWTPHVLEISDGRGVTAPLGRLTVPETRAPRDSASKRQIALAFVRLPSTAEAPRDPIIFLAGGPGDSGIEIGRHAQYYDLFEKLRTVSDVILLDQRGIGRSTPRLGCRPHGPVPLRMFESREIALAHMSAQVRACADQIAERGVDLAAYDVVSSADDIDDLRQALGASRVILVAHSYGTHLALATLRRHPERIAAAVLSSTEGLADTWKHPAVFDLQLQKLSRMASGAPGVDSVGLVALTRRVMAQLDTQPAVVTLTDPRSNATAQIRIGTWGLQYILRRDIGDANDFGAFPALLQSINRRDYSRLQALAQRRYGAFGVGGIDMIRYVVDCASAADAARLQAIAADTASSTFGAATNDLFPEICAATGVAPLPESFRAPFSSAVPALFISGTLDANTPPFQAEQARWGFIDSEHLVVENAGHESMLPDPAVQAVILDFLRGADVSGRSVSLPSPKFEWLP